MEEDEKVAILKTSDLEEGIVKEVVENYTGEIEEDEDVIVTKDIVDCIAVHLATNEDIQDEMGVSDVDELIDEIVVTEVIEDQEVTIIDEEKTVEFLDKVGLDVEFVEAKALEDIDEDVKEDRNDDE